MTATDEWTVMRLLTWTQQYLQKYGSESPRLDAEVLLAEARQCQRIELYTAFDEVCSEAERVAFRELVRRRAEGTPVAYLVGSKEFYSLSFRVNQDVLIPRPETEFLVIEALDLCRSQSLTDKSSLESTSLDIADVGTGSGAIAVCLARELGPLVKITAIDLRPAALVVAQANAEQHGVADRICWLESDLLAGLPAEPQFDVIVSNPPYVSAREYQELPREVREHEPHMALVGGPHGWEIIQRLIAESSERLRSGGWLLLEISPQIREQVLQLFDQCGEFAPPRVVADLAGLSRVVLAQRRQNHLSPDPRGSGER